MQLLCSFIKKRLQHRCFSVNFAKCLRMPFLLNISERLHLNLSEPTVLKYRFCYQHERAVVPHNLLGYSGKKNRVGGRRPLTTPYNFFLKFLPCSCLFVYCLDIGIISFTVHQLHSNPRVDPLLKIKSKSIYQYQTDHTSLKKNSAISVSIELSQI